MKTIAIASGKGGVGKTVITASVANDLLNHYELIETGNQPRILVLDFDLHSRGLTYLMYPHLDLLAGVLTSTEDLIQEPETHLDSLRIMAQTDSTQLVIVPASLRPAEEIPIRSIDQNPIEVLEKLDWILGEIARLDVDIVIIDTRAGPDVLSISAALVADVTWLVLEQDRISWRSSMNFLLQTKLYERTLHNRPIEANFLFLPNKVTRQFNHEIQNVLEVYDFLPSIPLDTRFFEEYAVDPFQAISPEKLANTRFGRSITQVIRSWAQLSGITTTYQLRSEPVRISSVFQRVRRLGRKSDLLIVVVATYALIIKWTYVYIRFGIYGSELLTSMLSDIVLLAILFTLFTRQSRY